MRSDWKGTKSAGGHSKPTRRAFTRSLFAAGALPFINPSFGAPNHEEAFDYIVIGAGAGGGPVAARLAREGYKVALLEAGLDAVTEASAIDPTTGIIYQVPAFAGVSAEHPYISWDFYVKHYKSPAQQARDPKTVPGKGILYPRGSTLGGSTAHDAMLFVYPHDKDWDDIAETTGDRSWGARKMRQIFERLENCGYCQPGAPGHGFNGYINSSELDERIFDNSPILRDLAQAGQTTPGSYSQGNTLLDLNHPLVAKGDHGTFKTPMHVATKVRISIREHVNATRDEFPNRLFIMTGALASKIIMNGKRAVGVEFLQGSHLYEAAKLYDPKATPPTHSIYARKEVIVSAGVFNTPQLLKLSGIGPRHELHKFGIDVVSDLPGVGENLQDRYELAVNVTLNEDIPLYTGCRPDLGAGDPCLAAWFTGEWQGVGPNFYGPYANNAAYTSRVIKSKDSAPLPDLFLVGQATSFHGFFPGFSIMPFGRSWTWLILKAHTHNTSGSVTLRSTDPRRQPEINFHYFHEGNDFAGDDLDAVVKGVKLARSFNEDPLAKQHIETETYPGPEVNTDSELRRHIKDNAWGHHASCTAKIGADCDPMAVLDSSFRVRGGVKGLRVVDACAFPRIPGFFPVASVIMIGEKAGDVILEQA